MSFISEQSRNDLVQNAINAQKSAYAPYSNYNVGAALLTKSGKIYFGCNVENAAYPLCCCAERTAIANAVCAGERDFVAIAVVTKNAGAPCGGCRQVLNEFNSEMLIIMADEKGEISHEETLDKLLPLSFGPSSLK
ncbi:MAG: cytidine deaminase [Parachlamydiales bacterium]|nr:cytidine deaminase [Parachlamydiales bacterium]